MRLDAPWPAAFDELVEDFDHDGFLDAILVGFGRDEILFFAGREDDGSSGFFEPGVSIVEDGEWPEGFWHLASGDFDGNGFSDVLAASPRGVHAILMNEGERRYSASRFPAEGIAHMITTGDFDGDGHEDVALGSGSTVTLFAGHGDATFTPGPVGTLRVNDVAVPGHRFRSADVDRDGRDDLCATANRFVVFYLGADIDPGTLALPRQPSRVLPVDGTARFVEIADFNGDGALDVAALAATGESIYQVFLGYDSPDGVEYLGQMAVSTTLEFGVLGLGDVDADGAPDLVVTSEASPQARVFLNDASCIVARFQPGDANRDGERNVTDAVAILSFLFLGGPLDCPGAAETDGDGTLGLTDAVYLLNFLFLGGDPPAGDELVGCES